MCVEEGGKRLLGGKGLKGKINKTVARLMYVEEGGKMVIIGRKRVTGRKGLLRGGKG